MTDVDEEKSCFKCYWTKPRKLRSTVKRYFTEARNNSTMAEKSSHSGIGKSGEKSTRNYLEKTRISLKDRTFGQPEANKKDRVRKDSEGSNNVVKRLTMRYEEISQNVMATGGENTRATGAIKKRLESKDDNGVGGKKKRVEFGDEKIGETKNRVKINAGDNDVFAKPRFKIYSDERPESSEKSVTKYVEAKIKESFATARHVIQNRRIDELVPESSNAVQNRFTPIDGLGVPLIPKKVKVQHRKSLMTENEKSSVRTGSITQGRVFELPYVEDLVKMELAKEKPMSRMARGFRDKNITVRQRKIILKFLIRLNTHSSHPSFLLHQTVNIFDAVLDAKMIRVEELQLVALASMWIALKREEITYRVPSAAKMISYAKDLYEGQVDLLLKCERDILRVLNFEIVFPDPFSIMCHYITTCRRSEFLAADRVELTYYCGCYMLDLSLFDEELMQTSAVLLAAAAAETALFFVVAEDESDHAPYWYKWRAPDASSRFKEEEIGHVRSILIQLIKESHQRHNDGEIIFKKYSRSRNNKISHFLCNKVEVFLGSD